MYCTPKVISVSVSNIHPTILTRLLDPLKFKTCLHPFKFNFMLIGRHRELTLLESVRELGHKTSKL